MPICIQNNVYFVTPCYWPPFLLCQLAPQNVVAPCMRFNQFICPRRNSYLGISASKSIEMFPMLIYLAITCRVRYTHIQLDTSNVMIVCSAVSIESESLIKKNFMNTVAQ